MIAHLDYVCPALLGRDIALRCQVLQDFGRLANLDDAGGMAGAYVYAVYKHEDECGREGGIEVEEPKVGLRWRCQSFSLDCNAACSDMRRTYDPLLFHGVQHFEATACSFYTGTGNLIEFPHADRILRPRLCRVKSVPR